MHADEAQPRHVQRAGQDVYHYHLHVVYITIAQKKKIHLHGRNDAETISTGGTVETIHSHESVWSKSGFSPRWTSMKYMNANGKLCSEDLFRSAR